MDNNVINTILKFLERVELRGTEAPSFLQCVEALHVLAAKNDGVQVPIVEPEDNKEEE